MPRRIRVALALGSGGARGYAHIGALEVLEERGYEVVSIAGSSMGALVGGLHAAGALGPFAEWARTLTQRDVLRLMDPSLRAPGAIRGEKILARVSALLTDVRIEDLSIPFTAVATDLIARKEVWFQEGPLDAAIRASIALPGFFTPVMSDGLLLADGGLMNPVPVEAITSARADLTVAISLGGDRVGTLGRVPSHEPAILRPAEDLLDRLRHAVEQVREIELRGVVAGHREPGHGTPPDAAPQAPGPVEPLPAGLRTIDVVNLSLEAMQSLLERYRLAGFPPDVMVTVPSDACGTLDFHVADEMIRLGRDVMAAALDRAETSHAVPTDTD